MLSKLDRVPEQWDGHELRAWAMRVFGWEADTSVIVCEPRRKTARDFKRTLINENLI